jgi:hypothetical protein
MVSFAFRTRMTETRSSGGVFSDAPGTNVHAGAPKLDVIFVFKVFVEPVVFNSLTEILVASARVREMGKGKVWEAKCSYSS